MVSNRKPPNSQRSGRTESTLFSHFHRDANQFKYLKQPQNWKKKTELYQLPWELLIEALLLSFKDPCPSCDIQNDKIKGDSIYFLPFDDYKNIIFEVQIKEASSQVKPTYCSSDILITEVPLGPNFRNRVQDLQRVLRNWQKKTFKAQMLSWDFSGRIQERLACHSLRHILCDPKNSATSQQHAGEMADELAF